MELKESISPPAFNNAQKALVNTILENFNQLELTWLAGYLTGISLSVSPKPGIQPQSSNGHAVTVNGHIDTPELTVLYGSRTGNGETVAKKVKTEAEGRGFRVHLQDMNDYPLQKLKDETYLLVIVSTHGEGVPPVNAESFYDFLHGKRAPKLTRTKFSVLALGDSTYVHFCKTGRDIDKRLEELGGERFFERAECDVDFAPKATEWTHNVLDKLSVKKPEQPVVKLNGEPKLNGHSTETTVYNKQNPYKAKLLEKIQLNGRGSDKETWHYEISLDGSGITYQPGDSLGVFGTNSQRAVYELINELGLTPDEQVETAQGKQSLEHLLTHNYEISSISPDVLQKFQALVKSDKLNEILADSAKISEYIYGRDIIDLVQDFPVELSTKQLLEILRKLQPRLYSISSSSLAHPDEVHLTVAAVRYSNSRYKEGVCSTFLADRIGDEDFLNVYVEKNPGFRLPSNPDTPVIMVGPGTGIAPFRAFLEERAESGAKGKNWLFYGDRHFTTDFLYQTELLALVKKGLLTNLNVAFSRDTDKKVYVQHKMLEHSGELFRWLEEGAHFYVCGDMKNMWTDVNKTLINIISKEGGMSQENAEEYLKYLKKAKRYQVDVY